MWMQVPKVAGVDSLAPRLGHLLRLGTKLGTIKLRSKRRTSEEGSGSASSDASSPRHQPQEPCVHAHRLQAKPDQHPVSGEDEQGGTEEVASPDMELVGHS